MSDVASKSELFRSLGRLRAPGAFVVDVGANECAELLDDREAVIRARAVGEARRDALRAGGIDAALLKRRVPGREDRVVGAKVDLWSDCRSS